MRKLEKKKQQSQMKPRVAAKVTVAKDNCWRLELGLPAAVVAVVVHVVFLLCRWL